MPGPKDDIPGNETFEEYFEAEKIAPKEPLSQKELAQLWKQAHDRLIEMQKRNPDIDDSTDLAKHFLKTYEGYSDKDMDGLTSQNIHDLALSELYDDFFIETMLAKDGKLSSFAYLNYPNFSEEDIRSYHYIGVQAMEARQKLAKTIKTGYSQEAEGQVITEIPPEDAEKDVVQLYNEKFGRENKPEIVVIPGRFEIDYNSAHFSPATDFLPPHGGNSFYSTFFQRGED